MVANRPISELSLPRLKGFDSELAMMTVEEGRMVRTALGQRLVQECAHVSKSWQRASLLIPLEVVVLGEQDAIVSLQHFL